MNFENWNKFLQETLSDLKSEQRTNKERTEKKPAAFEEMKPERTPKGNKSQSLKSG